MVHGHGSVQTWTWENLKQKDLRYTIEPWKATIDHLGDLETSTINDECPEQWRMHDACIFQMDDTFQAPPGSYFLKLAHDTCPLRNNIADFLKA